MVQGCWVLPSASARSWAGKLLCTEGTWPRDPTAGSAGARGAQGAQFCSQAGWDLVHNYSPMEQPGAEQGTPQGIPIPSTPRADFRGQGLFALPTSRPPSSQAEVQEGPGNPSCSWKTQSKPHRRLAAAQEGLILRSHTRLTVATSSSFKQPKSEPQPKVPAAGLSHFALCSLRPVCIFISSTVAFPLPQNWGLAGDQLPGASWGAQMPKTQQVAGG